MFHKIVNNKTEIPYENILVKTQSKTKIKTTLQIFLFTAEQ